MGGEWNVFEVIEEVRDGHSREDHVDGVPHVPVGEHQDVGEVEQGAQHAHQHCQPAMDRMVKLLKEHKIDRKVLNFYNFETFMIGFRSE